jgi:hypothetical protein
MLDITTALFFQPALVGVELIISPGLVFISQDTMNPTMNLSPKRQLNSFIAEGSMPSFILLQSDNKSSHSGPHTPVSMASACGSW